MKTKKTKGRVIEAWAVVIDEENGELCHLQGSQLQVYSSKVFPNKYQKVVPVEIHIK